MDKSELLLRMLENPEQYSDEQLLELLADEECRELYEAMRLSADAFQMEDAKAKISAGLKDEEWQKFSMTHDADSDDRTARRHYSLSKIAALFIGVLMLSGIAYAAYRMAHRAGEDSQKPVQELPMANSSQQVLMEEPTDSVKQAPIVFENAELQTMLSVLRPRSTSASISPGTKRRRLRTSLRRSISSSASTSTLKTRHWSSNQTKLHDDEKDSIHSHAL